MSKAIFTSQLKNKEKLIDAADSKGRPIWKYQTHVFLLASMSKIWQGCPIPKCQTRVVLHTSISKFWQGFPIQKYQMPTIVEWTGFAISSDIDMAPRAK